MMFVQKDKYFVIRFPDGTFLYLEEEYATTIPIHVDSPIKAKKIKPFDNDFSEGQKPEHYLEPRRCPYWAKDGVLVVVESETIAIVKG